MRTSYPSFKTILFSQSEVIFSRQRFRRFKTILLHPIRPLPAITHVKEVSSERNRSANTEKMDLLNINVDIDIDIDIENIDINDIDDRIAANRL